MIARDINDLITSEKCEKWHLAAVEKINGQIIDKLSPEVKIKLKKNISADLTNIKRSEILSHFR